MNASIFEIKVDDLCGPEIAELLAEHLRCMGEVTPSESMHALNLDKLRQPGISFWSVWDRGGLAGCGALKELDSEHGEVKSMRTAQAYLRRGVGGAMLEFERDFSLLRKR
jgi:putative acetyltransferase